MQLLENELITQEAMDFHWNSIYLKFVFFNLNLKFTFVMSILNLCVLETNLLLNKL